MKGVGIMGRIIGKIAAVSFILILVVYIGFQTYRALDTGIKSETARFIDVYDAEDVTGLLLREEHILQSDVKGTLSYPLEDGDRVAKNGVVAYVYANEEEAVERQAIARIDREIEELSSASRLGKDSYISTELLDRQINEKLLLIEIANDQNRLKDVAVYRAQLLSLMNKRQVVTGQVADFSKRIFTLTTERDALKSKYSDTAQTVTSNMAGVFFSEVDGYENVMDIKNIAGVNKAALEEMKTKKGPVEKNTVGKISLSHEWYYVCNLPENRALTIQSGTILSMSIPSMTSVDIPIVVYRVNTEDDGTATVIFQSDYMSADIATLRDQEVTIVFKKLSGLKISTDAIQFKDGERGVYIISGASAKFVKIDPIYMAEKYVVCNADSIQKGYLKLYDEVILNEKDLHDGKLIN